MANAPAWLIDAFGVTAGCCSMLSFIPQIVKKMLRERDAEGVSLKMYAVTIFGFLCWTMGCSPGLGRWRCRTPFRPALTSTVFILRRRFGDGQG